MLSLLALLALLTLLPLLALLTALALLTLAALLLTALAFRLAQELMTEAHDETWFTVLDINLTGAYRTMKRCLPAMLAAGWGRIINIGSTASSIGFARHAAAPSSGPRQWL